MAHRPRDRRIRVRGRQRDDIDIDLLLQAVLAIADEQAQQHSADPLDEGKRPEPRP